jgi:hypothetical protein
VSGSLGISIMDMSAWTWGGTEHYRERFYFSQDADRRFAALQGLFFAFSPT